MGTRGPDPSLSLRFSLYYTCLAAKVVVTLKTGRGRKHYLEKKGTWFIVVCGMYQNLHEVVLLSFVVIGVKGGDERGGTGHAHQMPHPSFMRRRSKVAMMRPSIDCLVDWLDRYSRPILLRFLHRPTKSSPPPCAPSPLLTSKLCASLFSRPMKWPAYTMFPLLSTWYNLGDSRRGEVEDNVKLL